MEGERKSADGSGEGGEKERRIKGSEGQVSQ